jgi:signal peptidase II
MENHGSALMDLWLQRFLTTTSGVFGAVRDIMGLSHKLRLAFLLLALVGTAGCDQMSKHVARSELGQMGSVTLPGGLGELRLAENPGSFLSLGGSLSRPLRLTLFTVAVGIGLLGLLAYLAFACRLSLLSFAGLGLIWAGGTSNLIDRITRHGLVSDFIFIRIGPFHTGVFNVADFIIMIGIGMFAFGVWRRRSRCSARD